MDTQMKVTVEGDLYAIFKKNELKNKDTGEIIEGNHVLQIIIKNVLSNGSIEHELLNISISENDVTKYKGKEGQVIKVQCNLVDGQYTINEL